ncbi:D-alanyl-D-alanine carboxypeptidase [Streptomyces acidicola]|nr:D-alanyl-D-alanine carboxypeptidase [Streptomyces acidicola]
MVPEPGATSAPGAGAKAGVKAAAGAASADPRLAVAQEKAPVAGAASASASVGVDQATAVFSRRGLEEAERALGSTEGSAVGDRDGDDDGEGKSPKAAEGADAGSGGSGASGGSGDDDKPESKGEAATEPEPEAETRSEAEGESEAERRSETDSGAEDAAESDGDGTTGTADGKAETEADEPKGDTKAEKPQADAQSASSDASDSEQAAKVASKADAPAKDADSEVEADADSASKSGSGSKPEPKSKPDSKPEPGSDSDSDGGSDKADAPESPVDQPTAVFTVRPPAVDQPTTMLKLGGDTKPKDSRDSKDEPEPADKSAARTTDKPEPKSEAKSASKPEAKPDPKPDPKPDSESERTSKFVALKPLDEPRPPKPAKAPPAPPGTVPADATAAIPQIGPEHTAQQPLPPKPPIDLLAELTNTPPPPPSPIRTIVRRVKIWTPLAVLLVIVFAVVQAVRPLPTPTLALTADQTYRFEGDKVSLPWPGEGQGAMDVTGIGTMDGFGEQTAVPIGSVAKAMTAYVILKEHPLKVGAKGPSVPVDALAEKEGGYSDDGESTLNTVKEGDKLSLQDAIAAIMIPSANNIARLLARWDSGGSEEEFVKKMNAAAKDLGMTNTEYTDPSGLKETTVSTAEDQVKLGNELVKMQALTDLTRLPSWTDPSGKEHRNYNTLVPYDNAIGIKTGSTTKAGGNLLFAATKEVGGETVIVVGAILGQHTAPIIDTVNAVSKTAMVAAQDALTSDKILKKGDVVGYVDDGLGGHTPVVATKDVDAVGWAGQTVKLALSDDGKTIPNEATTGTKVGALTVGDGKGDTVEVPVALQSDLAEPGLGSKLTRVG